MSEITTRKHRVETPSGALFAKVWSPRNAAGAPIVLMHDSLGCVALWRDFPEQLAGTSGREVIAYDRLGFGESDPHPGTLGPGFVADESRDGFVPLCEQLGIERCVLFGHSVGGAMASVCAARFPQRCEALITESAQSFVEDLTLRGIRDARDAFAEPGQLDRLKRYHGDKAAWVLSAWTDTWLSEPFQDWRLDDTLPAVECPVLAIHGEHDEYGSAVHPNRFASLSAGPGRALIIEACGHVPHKEKAEVVLEAVKGFLN